MASGWYIAEVVMEIKVAEDPRSVIHENLLLIHANSADEAYGKALDLGREGETSYCNPEGKLVEITFKGLEDLDAIYDGLEDGAELRFRYRLGLSPEQVSSLVRAQDQLKVFLPPKRAEGPDYASREVISEVEKQFGIKRGRVTGGGSLPLDDA